MHHQNDQTLPEIATRFNDSDRYINPNVAASLVLFLPVTVFRPEAMRVSKRTQGDNVWYEVETFDPRMDRWIELKSHGDQNKATDDALGWYPDPDAKSTASGAVPTEQPETIVNKPINPFLMQKDISASELATIFYNLLTDPERCGEFSSQEAYLRFMTAAAELVCDHCGGEVFRPAEERGRIYSVGIHGNDSLPDGSEGIWQGVGKEV